MNLVALAAVLFLFLCVVSPTDAREKPLVLPVWPGAVPGDYGTFPPERVRDPSDAPTKDAKWMRFAPLVRDAALAQPRPSSPE